MASESRHTLTLTLDESDLELLRAASRSQGSDSLSEWARQVLLDAAATQRARQADEPTSASKKKPGSSRPKCGCGATADPKGKCDGSCIMRF